MPPTVSAGVRAVPRHNFSAGVRNP